MIKPLLEIIFSARNDHTRGFQFYFLNVDRSAQDLVELQKIIEGKSNLIASLTDKSERMHDAYSFCQKGEPRIIASLKCRQAILEQLAHPGSMPGGRLETPEKIQKLAEIAKKRLAKLLPREIEKELQAPMPGTQDSMQRLMEDVLGDKEGNWVFSAYIQFKNLFGEDTIHDAVINKLSQ
jgi:hypothetical protein